MKNGLLNTKTALLFFLFFATFQVASAQNNKEDKQAAKKKLIKTIVVDSQTYVFQAQTAIPTGMATRNLSYGYDLTITNNTINSFLPYYGRAYSAVYGSTTSPLDFKSKNFDYNLTEGKKGGWEISIKTKDLSDQLQITLSIFDNGNATLNVISNNRQPIVFYGYITELKEKKKN